jgi:hypothetical protein
MIHNKLKSGDLVFENSMNYRKKRIRHSFENIVENFLENTRRPYYKDIVHNVLGHFKTWAAT